VSRSIYSSVVFIVYRRSGISSLDELLSKVTAATRNMTDSSRYEYDWQLWLSHINVTDFDLTKYDWRQRLGDSGCGATQGTLNHGVARVLFALFCEANKVTHLKQCQ